MPIESVLSRVETIIIFKSNLVSGPTPTASEFLQDFKRKDGFFKFNINPNNLQVTKKKIAPKVLTKGGFERSYQGNDLAVLSYTGTSGYMQVPTELVNLGINDVRLSPVWQKFRRLEHFHDSIDEDTWLIYKLRIYKGALVDYDYAESAEDPWQIKYSFTFEAITDLPFGVDRLGKAIVDLTAADQNELASTVLSLFP